MTPEIIVPFLEAKGLEVVDLDIYIDTMVLSFKSTDHSIKAYIELRKHNVALMPQLIPFKPQLKISIC